MSNKVQKIKQEIERLKTKNEIALDKEYTQENKWHKIGAYDVCFQLLNFIDSLLEEPTIKGITWEDVNTLESLIYQVHNEYPSIGEKSFGLEVLEKFQDCQDAIEEHAGEDLEEEITKCYKSRNDLMMTRKQFGEIIHHFVEWQKQKDKQDFMKKAREYLEREYEDIGIRYIRGVSVDEEIELFKQYIENSSK